MRGNGVILRTRERVKVRAKVDNLIVPRAAIRKSPILKAAVGDTGAGGSTSTVQTQQSRISVGA